MRCDTLRAAPSPLLLPHHVRNILALPGRPAIEASHYLYCCHRIALYVVFMPSGLGEDCEQQQSRIYALRLPPGGLQRRGLGLRIPLRASVATNHQLPEGNAGGFSSAASRRGRSHGAFLPILLPVPICNS